MRFLIIAAVLLSSLTIFGARPIKSCGLKSNQSIVLVSKNGNINQYTFLPYELADLDLYSKFKNGDSICVEGEINETDILSAKVIK